MYTDKTNSKVFDFQQHDLTDRLWRDRVAWHLTQTDLNVFGSSGL